MTDEVAWLHGCRCSIGIGEDGMWYGSVLVPRSHPVRNKGLDNLLVMCCYKGMWMVFIDPTESALSARIDVQIVAQRLKHMQDDWDRLSPYEREYRIW
jgi:hypothetical protein